MLWKNELTEIRNENAEQISERNNVGSAFSDGRIYFLFFDSDV